MVEIGAHTVRIMDESGLEVASHRREFGKARNESIDPSRMLEALACRPGAWEQCGVRNAVTEPVQIYIDQTKGAARRDALRLLTELNQEFGFRTAVEAFEAAAQNFRLDHDGTLVLASRMAEGIVNPVPAADVSLAEYDAFIAVMTGKETGADAAD